MLSKEEKKQLFVILMRQCFENHNETGSLIEKKEYYFCLIIDIFTRARINELLLLKKYRLANEVLSNSILS